MTWADLQHERIEDAMRKLGLTADQRAYVHSYIANALAENREKQEKRE